MGNIMAGLTSLPRKKNIKGQPHKLAYITDSESDILKFMGGAGRPVQGTKGVPAYFDTGEGMGGYGTEGAADYDAETAQEAAELSEVDEWGAAQQAAAAEAAAPTPSTARGDFADVAGLPPGTPMGPMGTSSAYTSKDPSQTLAAYNIPPETAVPGADLLMDPVIQDVLYSTKPSQFSRESYTQSVRDAVKSMTPEEKYGTIVDPLAPWESPLFGQRVGGYLPMLEEYTLPTYMGGFRGGRETSAPYALTDPESDRYQDVFMAFAGTTGGAIREALDAAKRGQTVEGALENTGHTAFGLPAQAPATGLANYLDREAMKGWAQGLGIVMSMTSPFMPAAAMGIPQDVWEDVKGPLNSLRETLRDAIPFFEKEVEPKFDKAVDVVRDNYEKNVEQTGTDILDTIFDAIKGKGASQEAREFGSNYQLPTISAPASPEPTLEDIAPIEEIDLERAIQTPDNMLADIAGRQNMDFFGPPTLESYLENIQELPMIDPPSIPNTLTSAPGADTTGMLFDAASPIDIGSIGGYPSEAFFSPDPLGPPLDLTQPVGGPRGLPSTAVPEADQAVKNINLGSPLTPDQLDYLNRNITNILQSPIPVEPSVTKTSPEISPNNMNFALNTIGKMARDPESPVTIDDYRAVENARTEEEFVGALRAALDKEEKSGIHAKAEAASKNYKIGN